MCKLPVESFAGKAKGNQSVDSVGSKVTSVTSVSPQHCLLQSAVGTLYKLSASIACALFHDSWLLDRSTDDRSTTDERRLTNDSSRNYKGGAMVCMWKVKDGAKRSQTPAQRQNAKVLDKDPLGTK
jgi:hypothetical protein